jgi:hypothetical protein
MSGACNMLRPKPSALSDEQVGELAENILVAINQGDHQAFMRDFSDQMKEAFPESEFIKLRELLQSESGAYLSRSAPDLVNQQGFAVYNLTCEYEKEKVTVRLVFSIDGDKVEGLFFDSANLRKVSQ